MQQASNSNQDKQNKNLKKETLKIKLGSIKYEKEISDLKRQLQKVTQENQDLKNKFADAVTYKDAELNKIRELNIQLQQKILEKMDEAASNNNYFDQFSGREEAVGFVRTTTGEIHCGNGIFIPKINYDNAVNRAAGKKCEGSTFVKTIVMSIFTIEELKNSNISGLGCRRTKTKAKPRSDGSKLKAVKDIFSYYLQYEKKLNEVEVYEEIKNFGKYVAEKQWDLSRPLCTSKSASKSKSQSKTIIQNSNETILNENSAEKEIDEISVPKEIDRKDIVSSNEETEYSFTSSDGEEGTDSDGSTEE